MLELIIIISRHWRKRQCSLYLESVHLVDLSAQHGTYSNMWQRWCIIKLCYDDIITLRLYRAPYVKIMEQSKLVPAEITLHKAQKKRQLNASDALRRKWHITHSNFVARLTLYKRVEWIRFPAGTRWKLVKKTFVTFSASWSALMRLAVIRKSFQRYTCGAAPKT